MLEIEASDMLEVEIEASDVIGNPTHIGLSNSINTKVGSQSQRDEYGLICGQGTITADQCEKLPPYDLGYRFDWDDELSDYVTEDEAKEFNK